MERLQVSLSCFETLERFNTKWLAEATQLGMIVRDEKAMKERFRQVNREQAKILVKMEQRVDQLERQLKKQQDINEVMIKENQIIELKLKERLSAAPKEKSKVNRGVQVNRSKRKGLVSIGTQTKQRPQDQLSKSYRSQISDQIEKQV